LFTSAEMEKIPFIKSFTTDDILVQIGEYGRFQWMLNAMFCVMLLPSTFQVLIMYFAALKPDWRCVDNSTICTLNGSFTSDNEYRCKIPRREWEFTQPKGYSIVTEFDIYCENEWIIHLSTSILFFGWAVGSMFLGWIADNYGRKTVLFPSIFVCLVVGLLSAFVPNLIFFTLCRLIVGLSLPGTALQMFIIISEFVGGKHRPKAGLTLWIFLTVAFCLVGIKAYFIRRWKILFVVCTAPYFFVLLFYKFIPESVRWLRLQNRTEDALEVFQRIAFWNKTKLEDGINLKDTSNELRVFRSSPLDLFRKRSLLKKTLIQGYAWMASGMIFYGLSLSADDLGGSLYLNYILVSLVELPAILIAMYSCERFGRKTTIAVPMLLGGLLCGLQAITQPGIVDNTSLKILLALLGKMFITMSFDSIYTWSAELYPTELRAEGLGFCQVTSRLGAAIAPWTVKGFRVLHRSAPFLVMCVLAVISAATLWILPETKGKETFEIGQEEKSYDDESKDKIWKDTNNTYEVCM